MDINNDELKKDLEEQYAMLEEEIQEDKKKKRYLLIFIFFLSMFLIIFGTTFSYYRLYEKIINEEKESIIKDLYIEGYEDAFEFDPSIYKYVLYVSNGTTSVNIKYVLGNLKYQVEIIGNDNLKPGVNEVQIIIKDEEGNEIKYTIDVIVAEEETKKDTDLFLKNLSVSNHQLSEPFETTKSIYVVDGIRKYEDKIIIGFELLDNSNKVMLKINGAEITRNPIFEDNQYKVNLFVDTELVLGTNKFEIIISDNDGNEKKYILYLIVSSTEEQRVVEIAVDYGNDNGNYVVSNIIPGWESLEKQHLTITNNSNYNTNIDINWNNVINSFVNVEDLEFLLYKENKLIKTGKLPTKDGKLISNLEVEANSKTNYYISYKYIYSDEDQNIDQGKSFSTTISITLTK